MSTRPGSTSASSSASRDYPSKEALQDKFAIRYRITPVQGRRSLHGAAREPTTPSGSSATSSAMSRNSSTTRWATSTAASARPSSASPSDCDEDDDGKPLVFRDSMISNIRDLVDVVPRLNIFGDDELARLCEQVKEKIASVRARRAPALEVLRPGGARAGQARRRRARWRSFAGYFGRRPWSPPTSRERPRDGRPRPPASPRRRVSDCVTELLRKQPFFGSLALRLPLRADPTRETLASDGHEIRYSPRLGRGDRRAPVIETAMARVVMACALKHHTRRGRARPGALADGLAAGHPMRSCATPASPCRPTPRAWDGVSVEQAIRPPARAPTQRTIPATMPTPPPGAHALPVPGDERQDDSGVPDPPGDGDDDAPARDPDSSGERGRGPRTTGWRRRTGTGTGRTPGRRQDRDGFGHPMRRQSHDPSGTGRDHGRRCARGTAEDGDAPAKTPVDIDPPRSRPGTRPCTRR